MEVEDPDLVAGVDEAAHEVEAVGHRVVHGGERFAESALVDAEVIDAIRTRSEPK